MKKIFLGGKHGSAIGNHALVDDEDFDFLNKSKWYAQKVRKKYYACRKDCNRALGKQMVYMHREILKITENKIVDHRDGNGLKNQRNNLREATESQNRVNKIKTAKATSKYLGVYIENKKRKNSMRLFYIAQIAKDGERFTTRHNSEIEAARSYNEMALKYHGEFANLNVIIE